MKEPEVLRGIQVRTSLGPAFWLGEVGGASQTGFSFTFGGGYEFFSWLAAEAWWTAGFNSASQPSPPASGNFATQAFHAGLRLSLPLGPFDLFLRGGGGWMWAGPNILVRVDGFDAKTRLGWLGGTGFYYHTPRRRVFVGLEAVALGAIDFPGIMLSGSVVLGATLF